jgi:hypothetical protein
VQGQNQRKLPERNPNMISREFNNEFVVLDPEGTKAHNLQGPAAQVWSATADGTWPQLPDEQVEVIVEDLVVLGLLVAPGGFSRRSLLKAGTAGGLLVGIATIALPSAAAAASTVLTYPANGTTLKVPANTSVFFTLVGAGGAGGTGASAGNNGGDGGFGGIQSRQGCNFDRGSRDRRPTGLKRYGWLRLGRGRHRWHANERWARRRRRRRNRPLSC